jgi:uncharacterized protein (TIGR00369 family)
VRYRTTPSEVEGYLKHKGADESPRLVHFQKGARSAAKNAAAMDGLAFVRSLPPGDPMPMARHFSFRIASADYGHVTATATPQSGHHNPFDVVQGGFAATVLDIALGLVSISVLTGDAQAVATTDLSVRYLRSIRGETRDMHISASTLHVGRQVIVAEAKLHDDAGSVFALAQSTSLIVRPAVERGESTAP